jgi:hypothetical protein
VLDGITYTLLYCYQHNGMDCNEYNINNNNNNNYMGTELESFHIRKANSFYTSWRPVGEWRIRSTHFQSRHQIQVIRHIHAMAALDLYKSFWRLLNMKLGEPQNLSGPLREFDSSVAQTVLYNHLNAALRHHFIRDINNTVKNF